MNRYWNITPLNQPASNINVRFYYNTQDIIDVNGDYPPDSLPHTQLRMYKLASGNPDPSTNWANATAVNYYQHDTIPSLFNWRHDNIGNDQHQAEFMVNSFSGGGAGAAYLYTLPVTGLTFNVRSADDHIKLSWSTLTEVNSKEFLVQRSIDGNPFETIATLPASGNSNTPRQYAQNDFTVMNYPGNTVASYRVYQVDMDGRGKYSEIKSIKLPGRKNELVLLYNPVNQQAILKYNSAIKAKASIRVLDQAGRIIIVKEVSLVAGNNQMRLNTSALAKGIYKVELISANDVQRVRMMKE
jgi:hypothetical protein